MDQAELDKKEQTLAKMEKDIQSKCAELDNRENSLKAEYDKKFEEIEKSLSISKDGDLFGRFYSLVNEIYTLWVASKGSDEGLEESFQQILTARKSIQKD